MTTKTETTTYVAKYTGDNVTIHIASTWKTGKTACGRTIVSPITDHHVRSTYNGWAIEQGEPVADYMCGRCMKSDEAPCEIQTYSGDTIINHKMSFTPTGFPIACQKCNTNPYAKIEVTA